MTKLLNYLKTYTPNPSYNQEREDGRRSFVQYANRLELFNNIV